MNRVVIPIMVLAAASQTGCTRADTYTITLDPEARDEPATGRIVLFFSEESMPDPIHGPFFENPQPIASISIENLAPGDSLTIDNSAVTFPESLDRLSGTMQVQAILDCDTATGSPLHGSGNVYSDVVTVELSPDTSETIVLTLRHRTEPFTPQREADNLFYVELRSELLSDFYGSDVFHRAGVAVPLEYLDPDWERRHWPAVYEIPGFGGRHDSAWDYADMLNTEGIDEVAPIAAYIVLDPDGPFSHHGFVDSANNGPRATALVTEFIPYLEDQFRLIARPEARLLNGHSSGGWSALWLQLNYPGVFGGCWSTAPDPIDFHAFQASNLYEDTSLYESGGDETPSFRRMTNFRGDMEAAMSVRQEAMMEYAIDPTGMSGGQWDAWEACFSPRDAETGMPRPMFEASSGTIDRHVVEHWRRFDITQLVTSDWDRYGPVVMQHVRLSCGMLDSFYLERAVMRFKEAVESRAEQHGGWDGPGYVFLKEGATHGNLRRYIFTRINAEMREHLFAHELMDKWE